jgi:hypothetical protein
MAIELDENGDIKDLYYVYIHKDPTTGAIRYVGMGRGQRAWMLRNSGKKGASLYGHRSEEHWEWFLNLEQLGLTLEDIVVILHKTLSKKRARELESQMVEEIGYERLFNKQPGKELLKLGEDDWLFARLLRTYGMSYAKIAKALGVATMTVYRGLKGGTKNVSV